MTRDLKRTTLPALPPALGFDGEVEYMKQVELWRRWVQWEKDDPLVLKEEDKAGYKARIIFVYHQALMALRFWPEMWFDAAEFCFNNNLEAEGKEFLLQGIGANPESSLLAFKRAERLELSTTNGNDDESKARRGAVVREPYDKLLDALYVLIGKAMAREARDISRIEAEFAEASNSTKEIDHDNDREEDDNERKAQEDDQKKQVSISIVKTMNTVQTSLLNKTISHAWIALMRCMQRMQGKGKVGAAIGGSRQIFTESRKRGRITSDVWIAAAMLEFHAFDGESAKRIFERGMKLFPDDERYALEYVKHLIATNDHTSKHRNVCISQPGADHRIDARVVFETTVGKLSQKPETAAKAKPLYAFFHDFESRYGELSQIVKLEKRMREAFPDDPRLAAFSQRFVHEGFDPTAIRPIISPAIQAKPKAIPSIDTFPPTVESPPNRFVQVTGTNSPKRPMQFEESDNEANRPRKLPRAESPLKGAAGRRLDQQKRNRMPFDGAQYDGQTPAHLIPSLPRDVLFLLSIIPPASTYHATRFKPEEMVRLIQDTHLPGSASQLRLPPQPPPGGAGMPRLPPGQFNGKLNFLFRFIPHYPPLRSTLPSTSK
jgi:cleavage stimulation factor subunit 3